MFSSNLKFLVSIFYYLLLLIFCCLYLTEHQHSLSVFCDSVDDEPLTYAQMEDYLNFIFHRYSKRFLYFEADRLDILKAAWECEDRSFRRLKIHIIDHLIKRCQENMLGFPEKEHENFVHNYHMLFLIEFRDITTAPRVADYIYYSIGTPY